MPTRVNFPRTTNSPAGVETEPHKAKVLLRGLMSSSVLLRGLSLLDREFIPWRT